MFFRFSACAVLLFQATVSDRTWGEPSLLCIVEGTTINESSGVAASLRYDGVFYTQNDSGDKPRFFRFDALGKLRGTYEVKGAEAIDWEDMACATIGSKPLLFFGDIGDNFLKRKSITVYRVVEPIEDGERTVSIDRTYELTYPDGPQNCEALFVTADGSLWLVTKSAVGDSRVYTLTRPQRGGKHRLKFAKELKTDTRGFGGKQVTGADVSPDGRYVALRTYTGALEYRAPRSFEDWVKATPKAIKTAEERQGEAVCYAMEGMALVTTSESAPLRVSVVRLSQQ